MQRNIWMQTLIKELNAATLEYNRGHPIITDEEWDNKYFQLKNLEAQTGIHYGDSPTSNILYEEVPSLEKKKHNHPMLSLDKTKNAGDLIKFFENKNIQKYICMDKMDGLTCSLEYDNGRLIGAETRGNGTIGESIYHNALHINNIPEFVNNSEHWIIDGEIICTVDNFERINVNNEYKNPRNFAAGSIRLLDSAECAKRQLSFIVWDVIKGSNKASLTERLTEVQNLGFDIVPYISDTAINLSTFNNHIEELRAIAKNKSYPIDGVVFRVDDYYEYYKQGFTEHHFNGAIAFKFYDETYETTLRDIEWSMGRTGKITPIAIFDEVNIDGTAVSRASLHNLGIMDSLGIRGKGQSIEVAKMNMIIPQIVAVLDNDCTEEFTYPKVCPVCGAPVTIEFTNTTTELVCSNPDCEGKMLNKLDHFCSKKGLDIKGLSKATLSVLMDNGWVNSFTDIFTLFRYRQEWIDLPGFGSKSVDNILNAISKASLTTLDKFICAIGIPQIGQGAMKDFLTYVKSYPDFRYKIKNNYNFETIPNFGPETNAAIYNYDFSDADAAFEYVTILPVEETITTNILEGKRFVITGKLAIYKNRATLEKVISDNGGIVSSAVTNKTNYLIANAAEETTKYKTAQRLNVTIITEKEFEKILDNN